MHRVAHWVLYCCPMSVVSAYCLFVALNRNEMLMNRVSNSANCLTLAVNVWVHVGNVDT